MFMSPLQMPCMRPPYGRIAVVDLQTRHVLWNKRLGHDEREWAVGQRSLAVRCRWAAPLAAGLDASRMAIDLLRRRHGSLLPRVRPRRRATSCGATTCPAPAQATPMSYLSPQTKRQIVSRSRLGRGPLRHGGVGRQVAADPLGGPHHRLRAQRHSKGIEEQQPRQL